MAFLIGVKDFEIAEDLNIVKHRATAHTIA